MSFARHALACLLFTLFAGSAFAQSTVIVRDQTSTKTLRIYNPGDAIGTIGGEVMFGSDGANARALLTDSSGRLITTTAAAAPASVTLSTRIAGENIAGTRGAISDWLEIYKAGTYTSTPTKTTTVIALNAGACTTAGGATCTIIYAATEWLGWPNFCITIKETAGANPVTNVLVEYSPDNSSWEVSDSTTFAALAASSIKSLCYAGNAHRYLRVEGRSAAGSTTDVWITANQG